MRDTSPASRVGALDWPAVSGDLDAQNWAVLLSELGKDFMGGELMVNAFQDAPAGRSHAVR